MQPAEVERVGAKLGRTVVSTTTLAGGFSHETCLLTLSDGQVVVRLGGSDPAIEAAVMAVARRHVAVPEVLCVLPAGTAGEDTRPAMVLEHVGGTLLSRALAGGVDLSGLGAEVGRVAAGIGAASLDRPGFFADARLTIPAVDPWSRQLPGFAATCMAATPAGRLDLATRRAWADLCAAHAPALDGVDGHARLVHADLNPKNILVIRSAGGWRVSAVLDWEFSFAGCPYTDAANMARFGDEDPAPFRDGFRTGFAQHQPADLPLAEDWAYLGRVMDMFALSDLVTRPVGHPVAERAAVRVREWVALGVPRSC